MAADELADDVDGALVVVELVAAGGGAVEDGAELFELEWLLDPHAATSTAMTSAAPMRLTIDPA